MWNYHPHRISAVAFLALGYIPPLPTLDIAAINAKTKQTLGYETFGYQIFFASEGAGAKVDAHLDSFMSLLFPYDPLISKTHFAPLNMLEEWITSDRTVELPAYMSAEELEKHKAPLLKHGLAGPLNWYKNAVYGLSTADDTQIPTDRYKITVPSFYGGGANDFVCRAEQQKQALVVHSTNATIRVFDTPHWVQLVAPERVNEELGEWLTANGL